MGMHAGAVVAEDRLGHEGHGHAVALGYVFTNVLIPGQPVRHLHQALKAHVDFGLARGGHFMVLLLDPDADLLHLQHHLSADILQRVGGRYGEIALLITRLVAQIAAVLTAVPRAFFRFDEVVAGVLIGVEADAVKDEELRLGAEISRIANYG